MIKIQLVKIYKIDVEMTYFQLLIFQTNLFLTIYTSFILEEIKS